VTLFSPTRSISDFDLDVVLETSRAAVVAGSRDAGPAYLAFVVAQKDAQPQMTEHLVLGLLHVNEKRREVNDPGGVGFDEFHAARRGESDGSAAHVQITRQRKAAAP
jgi:hypothetical protein